MKKLLIRTVRSKEEAKQTIEADLANLAWGARYSFYFVKPGSNPTIITPPGLNFFTNDPDINAFAYFNITNWTGKTGPTKFQLGSEARDLVFVERGGQLIWTCRPPLADLVNNGNRCDLEPGDLVIVGNRDKSKALVFEIPEAGHRRS